MKTFNTNPYSQINTARYFLLVLVGAIAFFLVLVKLEPLSYLSQYSPANNAPQSQQPPKTPIMAAATLLTASVDNTKNDLNNNTIAGDKAIGAPVANSAPAASAKAFESAEKAKAVVKTTVMTKEARSFLKLNDNYNNAIVKELAQVTDMQEFHFKNGRTSLDENAVLDKLDSTLWQCITAPTSYTKIIILGFTDNRGSKLANVKLGLKRAQGFKSFLIDKGIPEDKISVASFGPELPIATNNDAEGRARNRRVEFNLVGAGD
jgi:outer membrane protein OmpA-like peptidoglycan-associated protein